MIPSPATSHNSGTIRVSRPIPTKIQTILRGRRIESNSIATLLEGWKMRRSSRFPTLHNRTKINLTVAISTALKDSTLLIVIRAPTRSSIHLEITNHIKSTWLERRIRKQGNITKLAISPCNVSHAKQIAKHLKSCRSTIMVLTIIPILDNHNAECDRIRIHSLLLKMESQIKILQLNLFSDDVIHLSTLGHRSIQYGITVCPIIQSDISQLCEVSRLNSHHVVVFLDFCREAPVDRGNLLKCALTVTTKPTTAAISLPTVTASGHKIENVM